MIFTRVSPRGRRPASKTALRQGRRVLQWNTLYPAGTKVWFSRDGGGELPIEAETSGPASVENLAAVVPLKEIGPVLLVLVKAK